MTRFEKELRGELGAFWKTEAENKLEAMDLAVTKDEITIDNNGVARNKIGRALMEDQMEILSFTDWKFSAEATRAARQQEVDAAVEQMKQHETTDEELFEMRAAFGPGTTVVNVLTGEKIKL